MLRTYQRLALEEIHRHYQAGTRRVLLRMPTGAGKTTVFCELLKECAAAGTPCMMVVRGRKLVAQAAERLEREGVSYSILMAGTKPSDSLITLASIDTLRARELTPPAELIVIDECHLALSSSFKWLYTQYPGAYYLPVTATPFHSEPLNTIAEVMVEPVRVDHLIAEGYLVPARYYVPEKVDLSHVKKTRGEYNIKDLGRAVNQSRLFGPIVESYKRHGEGRPALLFAVNVEHSKRLCKAFQDAGIKAEHTDASDDSEARERYQRALESGAIRVLCSVGVLATGVDIPLVSCIIMARPTLSYPLAMQMAGRASRPAPGKKDFIYLDHANNIATHGFYEQYRAASLDGKIPNYRIVTKTCERCFNTWLPSADPACPGLMPDGSRCGHVNIPKLSMAKPLIEDEDFELREASYLTLEEKEREKFIRDTAKRAAELGWKPGAAYVRIKQRYGEDTAKGAWSAIRSAYKVRQ